MTNVLLTESDGPRAEAECILTLYAADGVPPHEARPSIMVADTLDAYVRGGDGTWLFASRILKPLFTGGDVPAMRDRVKRMAEGAKAGA